MSSIFFNLVFFISFLYWVCPRKYIVVFPCDVIPTVLILWSYGILSLTQIRSAPLMKGIFLGIHPAILSRPNHTFAYVYRCSDLFLGNTLFLNPPPRTLQRHTTMPRWLFPALIFEYDIKLGKPLNKRWNPSPTEPRNKIKAFACWVTETNGLSFVDCVCQPGILLPSQNQREELEEQVIHCYLR